MYQPNFFIFLGSFTLPQLQCVNGSDESRCDYKVDWARCQNQNYNKTDSFEDAQFRCSTSLRNGRTVVLQDANVTYERYRPTPKNDENPKDLIVKNSHYLRYSFKGIGPLNKNLTLLDTKVIFGCCFGSFGVVFSAFFLFAFLGGSQVKQTTSTEVLTGPEDSAQEPNHRRSSAFLQNVSMNIARLKTQTSNPGRADDSDAITPLAWIIIKSIVHASW